jgi:hypothetical protein
MLTIADLPDEDTSEFAFTGKLNKVVLEIY